MTVRGVVDKPSLGRTEVFSALTASGRKVEINGINKTRSSDLAQQLPALVIAPEYHLDFQQSSLKRRSAMDWLLFHVEQDFHDDWYRYQRVLQQRNLALKDMKHIRSRFSWDEEMAKIGEKLGFLRTSLIEHIEPIFQHYCCLLFDSDVSVHLTCYPGWDKGHNLDEILRANRNLDQKHGFTHHGPHRSDLKIVINGYSSKTEASNGQNKLLLIALRLAQIQYLFDRCNKECCLLIDDFSTELDQDHRHRLFNILSQLPGQAVVSATDVTGFKLSAWSSQKTFHVEHGKISMH